MSETREDKNQAIEKTVECLFAVFEKEAMESAKQLFDAMRSNENFENAINGALRKVN